MMRLILDFDGTITLKDTIGHLAAAAMAAQRARRDHLDLQPAWDALLAAYYADYSAYVKAQGRRPTTLAQQREFLGGGGGLRDLERASVRRVGEAGIFRGLGGDEMRRIGVDAVAGGHVAIRAGFAEMLAAVAVTARVKDGDGNGNGDGNGWLVSIISVNWSAAFIRGVVGDGVEDVVANETAEDGTIHGPTGHGDGNGDVLVCAADKLRVMQQCIGIGTNTATTTTAADVVYCGDSATDLECVLAAGYGVVVGEQSPLLAMLRGLSLEVPRMDGKLVKLSWIQDFHELAAAILNEQTY